MHFYVFRTYCVFVHIHWCKKLKNNRNHTMISKMWKYVTTAFILDTLSISSSYVICYICAFLFASIPSISLDWSFNPFYCLVWLLCFFFNFCSRVYINICIMYASYIILLLDFSFLYFYYFFSVIRLHYNSCSTWRYTVTFNVRFCLF